METNLAQLQSCMYQYSRAIYRSIKDLIDPYVDRRPASSTAAPCCASARRRWRAWPQDPHYFARPDRALFQDIRRYFPITAQAQVAWAVRQGVGAAVGVHRGADRGRRCSTAASRAAGDDAQGQGVPAHAAARPRLLPVAPAPRADAPCRRVRSGRRVAQPRSSAAQRVKGARSGRVGPSMSHDADKLIRQLSLVAFLMAERRPLTARDVKGNVEGYSEMSDEAFARRFYSDRAELTALGVPLHSQRDEFTGEELYTLRSEHYFLDRLELDDDELAALQTALYYLEGKFAYAEPLRLALQNLALGRPGFQHAPTETAERVRVTRARLLARARRPALEARGGDLEAAHGQVPLLVAEPRPGDRAHG